MIDTDFLLMEPNLIAVLCHRQGMRVRKPVLLFTKTLARSLQLSYFSDTRLSRGDIVVWRKKNLRAPLTGRN